MNALPDGSTAYPYPPDSGAPTPAPAQTTTDNPWVVTGGQVTQPDWAALLNQYLQPYQSIYDAQMKSWQDRVNAQSQLASNRFQGSDTSTMARLGDEHSDLARRITQTLASRGLLNSGDTQFQQDRENLRYKRAETDASNQLLDYLTGLQSQLADQRFQGLLGLQNQKLSIGSMLPSLYSPTVNPYSVNPPSGVNTTGTPALSWGVPGGTIEAY